MADRIAAEGHVVLLSNVFYRSELQAAGDRATLIAAIWPIASSLPPAVHCETHAPTVSTWPRSRPARSG
jgi:hypothetical protein